MYCRTIPNPERISPRDREQGKKVEFFVLTRVGTRYGSDRRLPDAARPKATGTGRER